MISLEKAEEQQETIPNIIKELEKKTDSNKPGRPLGKENTSDAMGLIKNRKSVVKTREDINNAYKKVKANGDEETEEDEGSEGDEETEEAEEPEESK